MSINEPTNCSICNKDITEGYRSDSYIGDKIVKSFCFKCKQIESFNEYKDTRRLRTSFIMENMLALYERAKKLKDEYPYFKNLFAEDKYAEILYNPVHFDMWLSLAKDSPDMDLKIRLEAFANTRKIENKIKEFEQKIWFGGLGKQIRASTFSGVSAKVKLGKVEYAVLTFTSAGRVLITFDLPDSCVTAITTDEDSDRVRMGIQGIDATVEQATYLIDTALTLWDVGKLKFKVDKKVGFGF